MHEARVVEGVTGEGLAMSYKSLLIERFRREREHSTEPRVLDYLQHRNDDALRAWRQRRFEYELGLGARAMPERRAS